MPVDKANEKLVMDRLVFIDDSIDEMDNVSNIQDNVFKVLSRLLIKELDVDVNGNIKRTRKNQKSAQKFSTIRNVVLTPEYKKKVTGFLSSYNEVKKMSDKQIKAI